MGKLKTIGKAAKATVVGVTKIGVGIAIPPVGAAILATDACKVAKKVTGEDCGKVATAVAIAAAVTGTSL